ncbi:MAG TPA: VWA domain-containing protein [Terriglobales bacterium]|nr:VWA domain-containing protein [Terriglobales bacterium]
MPNATRVSALYKKLLSLLLTISLAPVGTFAQDAPPPGDGPQSSYTFRTTSDLVLVDVVAHDKSGNLVRDLKQSDFTILEDGKPQHLLSFDIERPEATQQLNTAQTEAHGPSQVTVQQAVTNAPILSGAKVAPDEVRDKRLILLFFDLSAMEPEEVDRAVKSAMNYVDKQMSPADLVSIVTLGNSMSVVQDFTTDHEALKRVLNGINNEEGQGFEQGQTGSSEGTPDTGSQFTPDDTEYNLFNTDRRLMAISTLAKALAQLPQKKSVLYFAGGMQRTGVENQSELRAAVNAAVRSNLSLYTVDSRGLEALPPGGQAQNASLRGTSAYSGAAVTSDLDSNFSSQETLVTLASDTGGKAFLDTNDFSSAFKKVQQDTSLYYLLGYRSTNKAMDGHYRHIKVVVNRRDLKLEYRSGYFGPRDFLHFTKEDREKQLEDELMSEFPVTDLPVYVDTSYFRLRGNDYFVPASIVVPGSYIPFKQSSDKDKATLDIIGLVRESSSKFPIANVRETVKLAVGANQTVKRKNVQYNTAFMLSPGTYHVKFVVRENESGKIGSFESDFTVPDLKKESLKMSSVVLATQFAQPGKLKQNPLIRDGKELVPNLSHVFTADQQLTIYYEVYDPAKEKSKAARAKGERIRVLTNVKFFSGRLKTYETPLVEADQINTPEREATSFQLEVPLSQLRPGNYMCQVSVVDDVGGTFAFPRIPLIVRPSKAEVAKN